MEGSNPDLDLVNAFIKFGEILSIPSQESSEIPEMELRINKLPSITSSGPHRPSAGFFNFYF